MRAIATEGCGLLIYEQRSRSSRRIESLGRDLRNRQICEIVKDDGDMARLSDLIRFCAKHDLKMISVAELARYRYECDVDQLWTHMETAS